MRRVMKHIVVGEGWLTKRHVRFYCCATNQCQQRTRADDFPPIITVGRGSQPKVPHFVTTMHFVRGLWHATQTIEEIVHPARRCIHTKLTHVHFTDLPIQNDLAPEQAFAYMHYRIPIHVCRYTFLLSLQKDLLRVENEIIRQTLISSKMWLPEGWVPTWLTT